MVISTLKCFNTCQVVPDSVDLICLSLMNANYLFGVPLTIWRFVLIAVATTLGAIVGVVNSNTKKSTTHTVSVKYLFETISLENRLLVKHNPR